MITFIKSTVLTYHVIIDLQTPRLRLLSNWRGSLLSKSSVNHGPRWNYLLHHFESHRIENDIPTHYRCVGKHIPCKNIHI